MNDQTGNIAHEDSILRPDGVKIRPVTPTDEPAWRALYKGYAAFYKVPMDEGILNRIWAWLHDPTHPLEGLVAESDGTLVGFAHFRQEPQPLLGREAGFLDDLFVDPTQRGRGLGRQLITELSEIARARDWPMLSWITAQDNLTARRLYDSVANAAIWVTYEKRL